jgi:excinuclease UvrABC ATPase subunit
LIKPNWEINPIEPVTYLKAYDEIRSLFADQQSAKILGLKPAHFSFNVEGGRCDECQGEGVINVEMQFMPTFRWFAKAVEEKV